MGTEYQQVISQNKKHNWRINTWENVQSHLQGGKQFGITWKICKYTYSMALDIYPRQYIRCVRKSGYDTQLFIEA